MIRFVCDTPYRVPARLYVWLGTTRCPCCTFWRGALFGLILGAVPAIAMQVGPAAAVCVAIVLVLALRLATARLPVPDEVDPNA